MAQDKKEDQSLENFDFDNDQGESFFGVKSGETLTGAKELKSKGTKVEGKEEELEFNFGDDEEDETTTTVLEDAEAVAKKQGKEQTADGKKKESSVGTTKKIKAANLDDDDLGNGDDDDDDDDKKVDPKKKEKAKGKEDEEEEDDDDNADTKVKDKDKDKGKELTEEEQELEVYSAMGEELKDYGFFQNIKIKKGEKFTQEALFDKIDEEVEARVEDTVAAISEKMDDDGKRFLQFKMKGGRTEDFLAVVGNRLDMKKLDLKKEEDVEKIIRHQLTTVEKLTGDELEERLDYIKTKGDATERATKYVAKQKENQAKAEEALLKQAEEDRKATEQENKEFSDSIQEILDKVDKLGDFTLTKADKRELKGYITKPSVKMGKVYVPPINAEINRILTGARPRDQKELLILAKLIKNKFQIEDLQVEAETRVARKVKSKLIAAKTGTPRASTSGYYSKRDLADSFATIDE